jgi:preprotein translocase SecF subunit
MGFARLFNREPKIDFVRARFFAFGVTGLLFVLVLVTLLTRGLNFGLDFQGGLMIEVERQDKIDVADVRQKVSALGLGDVHVQTSGDKAVIIRAKKPPDVVEPKPGETPAPGEAAEQKAFKRIMDALGPGYHMKQQQFVGPTVSEGLFRDGMIATGLALLAIAIYMAVRFEWQFGLAGLVANFHDVTIAVGVYSATGLEFDLVSIAALLTLAGYSINETIVIFDRLRENMRRYKKTGFKEIINYSVNQNLFRTVMTAGSVLVAVLPMLIFGGEALFAFTLAIVVGIVVGTYSAIYVSSSLLIYLPTVKKWREEKDPGEAAAKAKA